ncbi:CLUMA_CG004817, isoform A [Clunio marinus]|uniref:CLUMA_CG004817, isoform A n=1 Tax=Clunio marinus TaxID=568069 RepID=A0A1J1HU97_9DIPT|nr:CLUMA_CG004817, isoform A [Clunio marinus]
MSEKSQKVTNVILAVGGAALGIFIFTKYRKSILQKLSYTKRRILHDFIKIPRTKFQVQLINDEKECALFIEQLRKHCFDFPVVGFDCEWVTVNNQRRKIALIQLCSIKGFCALFRVSKFSNIPIELRNILEDPTIIKTGITPEHDANYLFQDYAIMMKGTFDLRFLALLADEKAEGLGKLSKAILGIELDKNWRVRCSDWEIETLSKQQIDYAAKDAFVAIEIFHELYKTIKPNESRHEEIKTFCDTYTDIKFKNKLNNFGENDRKLLNPKNSRFGKNVYRAYTTRSTPYYDNCHLQAPDGELLCTCDYKKAIWYVKKERGVVISEDPIYTVRLNFEPAGRAVGEVGEYYKCQRDNCCVVCGKTNELIRKNVVPREYRKFFPEVMKSKTSHDVLLLCFMCHQRSNITDLKMRQSLQMECDAPLSGLTNVELSDAAKKLNQEQKIARALMNQEIPEKRKAELKQMLQKMYENKEINDELLSEILSKKPIKINFEMPSHGEIVVKKFIENGGLTQLEKRWRQHFLDVMEPKHMPKLWSVNHNINRLEIRASEGRINSEELKIAGVDAVILPKASQLSSVSVDDNNEEDNIDSSSDFEYHSAIGSNDSHSKPVDLDRTITEENYYSDGASTKSFYETIKSDGSTLDDFHSFASSFNEHPLDDFDESCSSLSSDENSLDSDTEKTSMTKIGTFITPIVEPIDGRLVGGANVGLGLVPFMASLRTLQNLHFCGGSILTNRWILTSGQCVFGRALNSINVVVGTVTLNAGGVTIRSTNITIHPGYNPATLINDVGLIFVASNIALSNNVQLGAISANIIGQGMSAQVSGWGSNVLGGGVSSNNLLRMTTNIISNAECRSRHSRFDESRVTNDKICTFTRSDEGTCYGDEGGALVVNGLIAGIASWQVACGQGIPDVYERIAPHRLWILGIIG